MAEQPNNNTSDEIDLGQLFQMIGRGFNKLGISFLRLFLYLKKRAFILGDSEAAAAAKSKKGKCPVHKRKSIKSSSSGCKITPGRISFRCNRDFNEQAFSRLHLSTKIKGRQEKLRLF